VSKEQCIKNICGIIVAFNDVQQTIACIKSVLSGNTLPKYIYLIDNKSECLPLNSIIAQLSDIETKVQIIYIQAITNLGFAGAINVALRDIEANYHESDVWILNNDVTVGTDTLDLMTTTLEMFHDCGMVGCRITDINTGKIQSIGSAHFYRTIAISRMNKSNESNESSNVISLSDSEYIIGCNMLVRSNIVSELGMIPEDYFMYYEDLEWQASLHKTKWSTLLNLEANIYHDAGQLREKSYYYYKNRASMLYTNKYYPGLRLVVLVLHFFIIFFDKLSLKFLPIALKGLWHGYKGRNGELK